uniref:Uncharacterized protein n=1 Tax=Eutreptiella gymnastica TaxID=73025 RepID=A0A7S4FZ90_9EUGL
MLFVRAGDGHFQRPSTEFDRRTVACNPSCLRVCPFGTKTQARASVWHPSKASTGRVSEQLCSVMRQRMHFISVVFFFFAVTLQTSLAKPLLSLLTSCHVCSPMAGTRLSPFPPGHKATQRMSSAVSHLFAGVRAYAST